MNPKKQVKELEKQLKRDPSSMVLRLRLAAALVAAGRAPEAVEFYRSVASAYHAQGRLEQATAVCESILEIDPYHRDTAQLLAELNVLVARRAAAAPPPPVAPEPAAPVAIASTANSRRTKRPSGFDLDQGSAPDFPAGGGSARDASDPGSDHGSTPGSVARRLPLPIRSLGGVTPSRPTEPVRVSSVRRKAMSSAPPPLARGNSGRFGRESLGSMRRTDELPLSQPRRGRPIGDEEAETRVAGGASTLPPPRPVVPSPPALRRPPSVTFDTPLGETPSPDVATRRHPRQSEDTGDDSSEVTIIDDGMALQRVLSPSLITPTPGARPELPMFRGLPERAIQAIAAGMTRKLAGPGDLVVREGEVSDSCFVVARGELRVMKRDPLAPRGDLSEIARLGASAFFGENALLAERRRSATVQAVSEVEYYEIPRALIRRVAAEVPEVDGFLSRFYRERLLANLMATAPFFAPLGDAERAELAKQFTLQRVAARADVFREGTRAGGFYLVLIGVVEITRAITGDRTVLLATLGEGTYFAEMSLLRGDVARASVTATRVAELAVLPARNFYALVASHPLLWDEVRKEARRRELDNVQMLAGATGSL